jgi:thioredoxin 2
MRLLVALTLFAGLCSAVLGQDPPPLPGFDGVPKPVERRVVERRQRYLAFTAPWCQHCKPAFKVIEAAPGWEIGDESAVVQVVDVDAKPELMHKYGITSLPTFILLRDGREHARVEGAITSVQQLADLAKLPPKAQVQVKPTVSDLLAEHLSPKLADRPVYGSLFGADFNLADLLTKQLAGKTFELEGGAVIRFPADLKVTMNRATQEVAFSPKPSVTVRKFATITAAISGAKVDFDKVTVRLDGFPDFTLSLKW